MIIQNLDSKLFNKNQLDINSEYVIVKIDMNHLVDNGLVEVTVSFVDADILAVFHSTGYMDDVIQKVVVYGQKLNDCLGLLYRELQGFKILNADKILKFFSNPANTDRTVISFDDGRYAVWNKQGCENKLSKRHIRIKNNERVIEIHNKSNENAEKMEKRLRLLGSSNISIKNGFIVAEQNADIHSAMIADYYIRIKDMEFANYSFINSDTRLQLRALIGCKISPNVAGNRHKLMLDRAKIIVKCLFEGLDIYISNAALIRDCTFKNCNLYLKNIGELDLATNNSTQELLDVKIDGAKYINAFGNGRYEMINCQLYNLSLSEGKAYIHGRLSSNTKFFGVQENTVFIEDKIYFDKHKPKNVILRG